ncbi:MAG TPA: hypothetical protein VEA99_16650 [Gemmatimonadaceae bacterium]|nr:hypothetical protein [Gemmatimonadaceae bacterium]
MARVAGAQSTTVVRRRRRTETPTIKKSFTLHEDVVQAADAAVRAGAAENLSAFVEAAIEEKLRRTRRAELYGAYQEAAQDPAFMADMRAVTTQFESAEGDGLRDA